MKVNYILLDIKTILEHLGNTELATISFLVLNDGDQEDFLIEMTTC